MQLLRCNLAQMKKKWLHVKLCCCLIETICNELLTLISNFITSEMGELIITIYILPNITRSTGNQIMKLGQLIEQNKSIFLEKPCAKNVVQKLVINLFLKNQN